MENVTEEMGIHKEWYKEAGEMTPEKLPEFIKKLTETYSHDYGTICHAASAAAIAAAWAIDRSPQGGITGFQAGCIMWGFIRNWNYSNNKTGLKIIDYDNFLYPQYYENFDKTLNADTWEAIQKAAKSEKSKADKKYEEYLSALEQYKIDIKAFVEKYPDYYERRKHYDPLGCGTGDEWEAEEKKKASGFEFAPQEPYEPVNDKSPVYKHWISIIDGVVPFGYRVESN